MCVGQGRGNVSNACYAQMLGHRFRLPTASQDLQQITIHKPCPDRSWFPQVFADLGLCNELNSGSLAASTLVYFQTVHICSQSIIMLIWKLQSSKVRLFHEIVEPTERWACPWRDSNCISPTRQKLFNTGQGITMWTTSRMWCRSSSWWLFSIFTSDSCAPIILRHHYFHTEIATQLSFCSFSPSTTII